MDFVTIEGADATGKSTLHRGFYRRLGEDEFERVDGVVDRLASELDRDVVPSREPGRIPLAEKPWWDIPGFLNIEPHLNQSLQWIGLAWSMCPEGSQARRVLEAAGFAYRHGTLPDTVYNSCKSGGERPDSFMMEYRGLKASWLDLETLVTADTTMQQRINRYSARDAIRHALIAAEDSDQLDPTVSGLLFFAGHLLHARWLGTLPDDTLVISDRSAESNLAYGRARGDDPKIEELYLSQRPIRPDLVLTLVCDAEEIKQRLDLRDKEENKSWGLEEIIDSQRAYHSLAEEMDAAFEFLDTTGRDEEDVIEEATNLLRGRFAHK